MMRSDGAGDSINVTSTINPVGAGLPRYNFTSINLPPGGVNANFLKVFAAGGNDDITLTTCVGATVSGSTGDDRITLIDCNNVTVTPLMPSDTDEGQPRPVDGLDTIDVQNSTWTNADGGDSRDTFTTSGNCSNSILTGGAGTDDFAVGGVFANGQIYGGDDRDTISGSGSWPGATIMGGAGNDWIDLRPVTGANISIFGNDGDDKMYAGSGGCTLYGGSGFDWMEGGVGDDWFYAVDAQMDVIKGGAHNNGDHAEIDWPNPNGTDLDWINGIEFVTYN